MSDIRTPAAVLTLAEVDTLNHMLKVDTYDLLHDLGEGDEDIAASLRGLGILGTRGGCGTCPLAMYIGQFLGDRITKVDVYIDHINLHVHHWGHKATQVAIDVPGPCQDFILAFDGGEHPQCDVDKAMELNLERAFPAWPTALAITNTPQTAA